MPAAPLAQSSLAPDHRDKTTEQKLKRFADVFCCLYLYIWFGGISRVCISLDKLIVLLICAVSAPDAS